MDYLSKLNPSQRAAVENIYGPTMVIAGAGSGKTRVLTYRIAHLLNNNIDAFQIMALTFTNKAAKEMKERIGKIANSQDVRNIWMGTFHSIFLKILRIECEKLNFHHNFTILDTDDTKRIIKKIIKESGLDDKVYKPNHVLKRISLAKTNVISPKAYLQNAEIQQQDKASKTPEIGNLYYKYAKNCFKSSAMDFDDLLYYTFVLFKRFPEVVEKYQNKFKFVLVDEFQDTNYLQYKIVKYITEKSKNICVVGDDAQSIYAFRGANIQNILDFQKNYPDLKTFKLEQNYRSTQTIVEAANSVIKNNKRQLQKKIYTQNTVGEPIHITEHPIDNEEAKYVAQTIFEIKQNQQAKNTDFAVLYRTNAQSRSIEDALRRLNIPYVIYGGLSFYQRKEIKDLLAYFRLSINNQDEDALLRIINYPARGIGQVSLDKLILQANELSISVWDLISKPEQYKPNIGGAAYNKLQNFVIMIKSFSSEIPNKNAYDLANRITKESGILNLYKSDHTPEAKNRLDNIDELLNAIKSFVDEDDANDLEAIGIEKINGTLNEFMQGIALLTSNDKKAEQQTDSVSLMTVHQAKGLEFPYVFIVGLEENLFPSQMSIFSREDLEEERRLFYVALTRAEKQVFISFANNRFRFGNYNDCTPSRFIDEIEPKYVKNFALRTIDKSNDAFDLINDLDVPLYNKKQNKTNYQNYNKPKTQPKPIFNNPKNLKKISDINTTNNNQQNITAADSSMIQPGIEIIHQRFGKGKVLSVEGNDNNKKATIFFQKTGQKQLLLKFAKLQIVK